MFISLIGLPSAGKHSVLEYLVENFGFTPLYIGNPNDVERMAERVGNLSLNRSLEVSQGQLRQQLSAGCLA